jgi:hypothetical protein
MMAATCVMAAKVGAGGVGAPPPGRPAWSSWPWARLDERLWDAHWRRDRGFRGVGALSRRLLHYGYGARHTLAALR